MKNNPEHTPFGPSGCLSREGLALFAQGKLSALEMTAVKTHLQACEFCALAAEGMAMADPQEFDQDLETIFSALQEVEVPEEELTPEFAEGLEGLLSQRLSEAEMQQFRQSKLERVAENQEVKKTAIPQKPFFRRYRLEMMAAVILLLLAIGARQIYVGLSPEKEQSEFAQGRVETEDVDEMETIQPEVTESEPFKEERLEIKPTPPQTKLINVVSDDLEVVKDDQFDIFPPQAEANDSEFKGNVDSEKGKDLLHPDESKLEEIQTVPIPESSKNQSIALDEQNPATFEKQRKSSGTVMRKQNAMEEEVAEAEIFTVVESPPEFPGGDKKRIEFLSENIKYPEEAKKVGSQGTVYITFVVENDGKISDARILRGIGAGCDEEALRVIRLMPDWKPGRQRGKPVRVQMNLPIKFILDEKSEP